jgi:hypothetical protein
VQLDINLFDPSLRPRKVLLPARIFAPALGAVAALLVTCAVLQSHETRIATQARRQLESQSATLHADIRKLSEQLGAHRPSPEVQAKAALREALRASREAAVAALRTSSGVQDGGHARFLRALARQSTDGLWLTDVTVAGDGSDIALRGRTLDPELVADYLRRLGREEALRGLAFNQLAFQRPATAEATPGTPPRFLEFAVTSAAVGDAPSASTAPASQQKAPGTTNPAIAPDLAALAQTPSAAGGAQ